MRPDNHKKKMGNARGALGVGAGAQHAQRSTASSTSIAWPQPSEDIDRSGADPAEQRGARGAGRTQAEPEQSLSLGAWRSQCAGGARWRTANGNGAVCDLASKGVGGGRGTFCFRVRLFYQ